MGGKQRMGSLELLRFAFCVCIVLLHSGLTARGGYLGVEYFFMLSGAFLAKSLSREQEAHAAEPVRITCAASMKNLLHRIGAILPYYLVSTCIGLAVRLLSERSPVIVGGAAADLLFLQNFGFPVASITGVIWYLGSLFFALWLVYPFMRGPYGVFTR